MNSCAAKSPHSASAPITMETGLSKDTAWTTGASIACNDLCMRHIAHAAVTETVLQGYPPMAAVSRCLRDLAEGAAS